MKLGRYLSKYISKDLENLPRKFGGHRYFCSLGIRVPTQRFQILLACNARDVEANMFSLMLKDTLHRIGEYCTINHWLGRSSTFGRMSGFEDRTCRWAIKNSSRMPPPD